MCTAAEPACVQPGPTRTTEHIRTDVSRAPSLVLQQVPLTHKMLPEAEVSDGYPMCPGNGRQRVNKSWCLQSGILGKSGAPLLDQPQILDKGSRLLFKRQNSCPQPREQRNPIHILLWPPTKGLAGICVAHSCVLQGLSLNLPPWLRLRGCGSGLAYNNFQRFLQNSLK